DPHLAAVPGHVRVVPGLPGDAAAVRAQLGRRVEVIARGDGDRLALALHVDRHDGVDGLRRAGGVVFAHGEAATSARVDAQGGVAAVLGRRDRLRRTVAVLPVQTLAPIAGEAD